MNLNDTLMNWLQIRAVVLARPDDAAAQDTYEFFDMMLRDDHRVLRLHVDEQEEALVVRYEQDGKAEERRFHREDAERLLHDIESNPKYNEP